MKLSWLDVTKSLEDGQTQMADHNHLFLKGYSHNDTHQYIQACMHLLVAPYSFGKNNHKISLIGDI